MTKLITANFARLSRSVVFIVCAAIGFVICVLSAISSASTAPSLTDFDMIYFDFIPNMLLMCAIFSPLYFGTEYSDGVMRAKIIAGHKRSTVFMANFVTNVTAFLFMFALGAIGSFAGVLGVGWFKADAGDVAVSFILGILLTIAMAAIFTVSEMLITSKAGSAVFAILLIFAMLICASTLYSELQVPEMASHAEFTVNGMVITDPEPNPGYVSGAKRAVMEFVIDVLPMGQSISITDVSVERPVRMAICSVVVTVVSLIGGLFAFKRKDLK